MRTIGLTIKKKGLPAEIPEEETNRNEGTPGNQIEDKTKKPSKKTPKNKKPPKENQPPEIKDGETPSETAEEQPEESEEKENGAD